VTTIAGDGALGLRDGPGATAEFRRPTGIAATLFLVFAGALAGFFPARAAARVNPIHALRDQ